MGKFVDLTGQKFGRLTVVEYVGSSKWLCKCDCGNTKIIAGKHLKDGNTKSCGCISKEIIDLTGQKFGKLTPIEYIEKYKWLCRCDCGNEIIVFSGRLKSGYTKSCGCLHKEQIKTLNKKHGLYKTHIYKVWESIKRRCYNNKQLSYKNYGARGIKMCDEWLDKENGFINFYNWAINNGYKDDLTIDRVDVNGDYEPSNCRWTTNKEQANNRRNNINITYNDKTQTLKQWCDELNLNYKKTHNKIKYSNIPFEDIANNN